MVLETEVPKDILVYEAKFIGPLTFKQMIAALVALLVDIIVYNLILKPLGVSNETLFYVIAFLDIPIFALSVNNPMGLPMKTYLEMVIKYVFMLPRVRKNTCELYKKEYAPKQKKKQKKTSTKWRAYQ